jgi:hypothetical protein
MVEKRKKNWTEGLGPMAISRPENQPEKKPVAKDEKPTDPAK